MSKGSKTNSRAEITDKLVGAVCDVKNQSRWKGDSMLIFVVHATTICCQQSKTILSIYVFDHSRCNFTAELFFFRLVVVSICRLELIGASFYTEVTYRENTYRKKKKKNVTKPVQIIFLDSNLIFIGFCFKLKNSNSLYLFYSTGFHTNILYEPTRRHLPTQPGKKQQKGFNEIAIVLFPNFFLLKLFRCYTVAGKDFTARGYYLSYRYDYKV